MLKWIGLFLLISIILLLFRLRLASCIAFCLVGVIFLLLLILLAVEAVQDGVFETPAAQEKRKN